MALFGDTFTVLENALDFSTAKNRAIASNISNIDTPNYKAKDVDFKNMLNNETQALEANRTDSRHIPFNQIQQAPYQFVTNNSTAYSHNGNNVDVDKEMVDLAKNQIYYNALVDRISGKFSSLQTVLRGGS